MGLGSWLTADTNETIGHAQSSAPHSNKGDIFLLQTNGKPAIKESSYEGYSKFGGVFVFDWLAVNNVTKETLSNAIESMPGSVAFDIECMTRDLERSKSEPKLSLFSISPEEKAAIELRLVEFTNKRDILKTKSAFSEEQLSGLFGFLKSMDLTKDNTLALAQWIEPDLQSVFLEKLRDSVNTLANRDISSHQHPLKFSYDEFAVYDDLPGQSKDCPHQGYASELTIDNEGFLAEQEDDGPRPR